MARGRGDAAAALHRHPRRAAGCVADGEVSGSGLYAVAAGSSGLLAKRAIAADLRTAGHRIAQRAERVTAVAAA